MMLNQFKHLSSQSVNCSKTEVFMAGINEEIKQEIVIELDFKVNFLLSIWGSTNIWETQ